MNTNLLISRSANTCLLEAKQLPKPKMLFSEFFYENEVTILFSDQNLGKSLLAVQIADSISKGIAIPGFQMDAEPQPVIYFDAEISELQFRERYEKADFNDQFVRLTLGEDQYKNSEYSSLLLQNIVQEALKTRAKIIIIDNISFLQNGNVNTIPFLLKLKDIKNKFGLTFLLLAHTTKLQAGKPIRDNDLYGSKNTSNFVDAIFAIGRATQGEKYRYIKQLKSRISGIEYGQSNVVLCEIMKHEMLQFDFRELGPEENYIFQPNKTRVKAPNPFDLKILDLISKYPDYSDEKIASLLGTYKMKVWRVRIQNKHNEKHENSKTLSEH